MHLRLLAAMALAVCGISAASSQPISYTLIGSFSGSLGAVNFNGVAGTITLDGDTTNVNSLGAGYYTNTQGISSITLNGIGTALFLSPGFGALSGFGGEGFFDIDTEFGTSLYNGGTSSHDLSSTYTDSGYLLRSFATGSGQTALTSLGELTLTGDDGTLAQFSATTASSVTPEPGSLLLVATGLVSTTGVLRKQRKVRRSIA